MKKDKGKGKNFLISFSYAIDGIIHSFRHEPNFRFHILTAVCVALLSLLFDLSRVEMAVLCITTVLVIFAELINTAIESIVDLIYDKYDPKAKIAKDVGAGAVLVTAFNAIFVGYFIFYDRIVPLTHTVIFKIQDSPIHLTFIALVLIFLFTIIVKAKFGRKASQNYLQGGTVSGHSALSFCAATIISFIAANTLVTILSLLLAFLVAESRVEGKIHSLSEVILGGLMGIAVAVIIFKLSL